MHGAREPETPYQGYGHCQRLLVEGGTGGSRCCQTPPPSAPALTGTAYSLAVLSCVCEGGGVGAAVQYTWPSLPFLGPLFDAPIPQTSRALVVFIVRPLLSLYVCVCAWIARSIRSTNAAVKQAKRKDYYKLLGVERSAGESEIKRAYYKAAKLWHPGEPGTARCAPCTYSVQRVVCCVVAVCERKAWLYFAPCKNTYLFRPH